jgi:hypothetical protein
VAAGWPRSSGNTSTAKPCPISDYAKANPVKSNLRVRSPRLPNLDAEEEASLVLAAQGGDRQAAKKLLDHFHGWIRHAAWKPWLRHQPKNFKMDVISNPRKERGETIDDYVGAGILAFCEAVSTWKPGRNRLFAYAAPHVYGAISNISWARKAAGFKDESNLARFIRSHFDEPLAAFQKFLGKYTPLQVYQEIARQGFLVEGRDEYSEGSVRDQGSGDSESGGDGCHIEKGGTTKISDDGSFNGPLFLHKHVSKRIDDAARDSDLGALRHLREVGRPAYALELVEKERKRIADCKTRDAAEWKKAEASRQAQAFAKLEKHRSHSSWLLPPERKYGPHHDARRTVRRDYVGHGPRGRRSSG